MRIVVRDHDTHVPLVIDLPEAVYELDRQTGDLHLFDERRMHDERTHPWHPAWRVTLAHGQWLAILP